MSLATRRTLSWLATLAGLAGLVVGYARLPAHGGVAGEIHWLLARDHVPAEAHRRVAELLWDAAEGEGIARDNVLSNLLANTDERVVHGALCVLSDLLGSRGLPGFDDANLRPVFSRWFQYATIEAKVAHLPYTLLCALRHHIHQPPERPTELWSTLRWAERPTEGDARWVIAATLSLEPDARSAVERVLFGEYTGNIVEHRLRVLDALNAAQAESAQSCLPLLGPDYSRLEMPIALNELRQMASDPIPQVRRGAGRILAVAGDPRGLPAFREWVKTKRKLPPTAEKMLTDLFGPNWRDPAFVPPAPNAAQPPATQIAPAPESQP